MKTRLVRFNICIFVFVLFQQAGVVTRSSVNCYTPCKNPVKKDGQCCPVCPECKYESKNYSEGERFSLSTDSCTECTCKKGEISCHKRACPILNCPDNVVEHPEGSCCPSCTGKRRIFNLPGGRCFVQNRIYKTGESFVPSDCTQCTCIGYKLQYVEDECCPRCMEVKGVCTVFGDPHYRTFDGRIYNFQGPCKYMLVHDDVGKSFSIRVRNDARTSPWFTWTRMLSIFLGKHKISLLQKLVVKVDKKRVKLPYKMNAEFSVVKDGHSVIFNAAIGLKVTWDGDSYVEVSVSSRFKRRLTGLCGNYNGIGADDMKGRDGLIYFVGEEFGNTWRVGSRAACSISDNIKKEKSPCKTEPSRKKRAKKECSLLLSNLFYKCRRKVDVRQFYKSCIADMCDCPEDKKCNCESFKAYAHACAQNDIHIKWEKHVLCPKECPTGAVYKKCSRRCKKTCKEPHKKGFCSKKCIPGCVCPRNKVLHDNKCIRTRDCPNR
ncbi:hypothetical protein KUTeg_002414 [Tegillarca granosa]|uniref:BMP-binding endothelial regulator protein n=1 Tax=Tegillarca granosa TaxID=220873 RepID=A0ABQ9FU88_TEGGR|nr:hypothetical protein KUTeg_002414 [Tegillarca granosa]